MDRTPAPMFLSDFIQALVDLRDKHGNLEMYSLYANPSISVVSDGTSRRLVKVDGGY